MAPKTVTATQQITNIRRLIESSFYEGRVQAIADYIFNAYNGKTIPAKTIEEVIVDVARENGISEVRMTSGNAKSEFIKDVRLKLKEMGFRAKRQSDKPIMQKPNKVADLCRAVIDEIGNSFPDGDPHDALEAVGRKKGIDPGRLWDTIAKEFKKQTGHESMYDYCAAIWKDYAADNDIGGDNPYRST